MRNLILVAAFLMTAACAKGGSNPTETAPTTDQITCNTLAGHYTNDMVSGGTLDISNTCTFTDSICGYTASYSVPNQTGDTTIGVSGTNGTAGCMSSTAHACQMEFNGSQLGVSCDSGAHIYLFTHQ
jgi:hypothetical protein